MKRFVFSKSSNKNNTTSHQNRRHTNPPARFAFREGETTAKQNKERGQGPNKTPTQKRPDLPLTQGEVPPCRQNYATKNKHKPEGDSHVPLPFDGTDLKVFVARELPQAKAEGQSWGKGCGTRWWRRSAGTEAQTFFFWYGRSGSKARSWNWFKQLNRIKNSAWNTVVS